MILGTLEVRVVASQGLHFAAVWSQALKPKPTEVRHRTLSANPLGPMKDGGSKSVSHGLY